MARLSLHRWRYSTRILFSGCDQATYQQDLVVHRTAGRDHEEASGGLKVWHIYIGPRCRPDYGDLRFTDRRGRESAYYLWPDYDSSSARVTVRLEGADAAGEVTVHYGNPSATTTSDGDATYFQLFDPRSYPPDAWTKVGAALTLSSETVLGRPALKLNRRTTTGGNAFIYQVATLPENYSVRAQVLVTDTSNNPAIGVCVALDPTDPHGYSSHLAGKSSFTTLDVERNYGATGWGSIVFEPISLPKNVWYTYVVSAAGTAYTTEIYDDAGNLLYSHSWEDATYSRQYAGMRIWRTTGYVSEYEVRAYSVTPPSILRTSRGVNPSYAGLAQPLPDDVIRFAGVGTIQILDDERYAVSGAGAFAIETQVSSPIPIAGAAGLTTGLNLAPAPAASTGAGGVISEPARLHTPLDIEAGEGSAYVAPTPVQFDVWQYRFESLEVSRSAQDALWRCDGQIDGLQAPLAYKSFTVRVPDHNGVLRTIFVGFVPGRDYVQSIGGNKSVIQGFDAGFYLTRQYLPNGDLYYPAKFLWTPMNLIKYWLGEEATWAGSQSRWEQVTGIMPYRIHNPSTYGHPYTPKDWNFPPMTTKAQAIQEVCEYSGMVFLVKWRKIYGVWRPCAYLVHQDDIDHATHGLDLPPMVAFTHPDPHVMDGVRVTMRSDEKYNRIEVRSASPSGAWFHAVRETPALRAGEELPIEYLEERSDLPIDADHGGWCNARADELYAYYTRYAYTYTLTLINRVDLELYQRCRFYGFDSIPSGEMMRIVAIRYNVRPTHTEVEITVTPDSRLSDLRRLQRSQTADSVSEVQTIAQSQIDRLAAGEVGTVVGIDGAEAIVELERKADSSVRGRIV